MNNNDISLFEKIVFVDNIPSEDEAKRLSNKYPFALFISDNDNDIDDLNTVSNERDWRQYAFNNIWKGGKRLTKFNNVNTQYNSINMDTYTIDLEFDMEKGLLSLKANAKVDGYKVVGFIQRTGNERTKDDYNVILNGKDLLNNFRLNRITSVTQAEWEQDSTNFTSFFRTDAIYTNKYILGEAQYEGFDTVDNKFYMIVSFESQDAESLYSVPANAYSIYPINEEFSITTNPMFADDKLKQILDIDNPEEKDEFKNLILKYTNNLVYNDVNQRCVIYEININKNVEPQGSNQEDTSLISFTFESLKNIQQIDVEYLYAYINPTGYELKANIENEWVTIDQNTLRENYFMPGITTSFVLTVYPENVRQLELDVNLTSRTSGETTNFIISTSNDQHSKFYNFTNEPDSLTNSIRFSITTPSDFIKDVAETAYLNLELRNNKNYPWSLTTDQKDLRYKCDEIKLSQYIFKDLELPNPWVSAGIVTSGNTIEYILTNPNALFYNADNSVVRKRQILDEDTDFKNLLIFHQHNNFNVETDTIENPLLLEISGDASTELSKYTSNLSTHNIPINSQITLMVPWISTSNVYTNAQGQRVSEDWIYGLYSYHGCEKKTYNKYVKSDTIKSISIVDNIGTSQNPEYRYGIRFSDINGDAKLLYDGGEDLYIDKLNNTPILFTYTNGQSIDAWEWIFNQDISRLKNYIVVQCIENGTVRNDVNPNRISITNGRIKIESAMDPNNTLKYEAYLKYETFSSNIIDANVAKLLIDWWVYIGPASDANSEGKRLPATNMPTGTAADNISTGYKLYQQSDSQWFDNTNANEGRRKATHAGGWIHLGKIDLLTAKFNRYNPLSTNDGSIPAQAGTALGWEQIGPGVLWDASSNWGLYVGVEPDAYYVIAIPNKFSIVNGDGSPMPSNLLHYSNYRFKVNDNPETYDKGEYKVYYLQDNGTQLFLLSIVQTNL